MSEDIRKDEIQNLIFQAIDQTISLDDFERLQDAIEQSDHARAEYLRAVSLSESLTDMAIEQEAIPEREPKALASGLPGKNTGKSEPPVRSGRSASNRERSDPGETSLWDLRSPMLLAAAATILALVGGVAFWFGQKNSTDQPAQVVNDGLRTEEDMESLIAGHATLRRSVDLQWSDAATSYREGDVLPDGLLQFDDGIAEIDFFCGATLIVEGPATLDIESDWSVRVIKGRLRANVPPAARGFIVEAAGSRIVDLGTEFALEVGSENARVEVIDGEVELRGGEHDGDHLVTGQRQLLKGTQVQLETFEGLSTINDVRRRRANAGTERFAEWKKYSQQLRIDERLIAYFPIAESQAGRIVRNASSAGNRLDGQLVGPVDQTSGRFGLESAGLEFDRPGARVRTRIDGEFQAFTFACWASIDSLEHRYNALFMGDGYETGEPHWQIRDDGRLMFSVMVDDTMNVPRFDKTDQRVITTAGLHHLYFTEPFWDISKSGQWFHMVAVYDPFERRVVQYVNGEQISSEEITDKFHIDTLRIGAAEIGNWGQPLRRSPWFAVRNLNGTIDELAIFNAALTSAEIQSLYEEGKPLGY